MTAMRRAAIRAFWLGLVLVVALTIAFNDPNADPALATLATIASCIALVVFALWDYDPEAERERERQQRR